MHRSKRFLASLLAAFLLLGNQGVLLAPQTVQAATKGDVVITAFFADPALADDDTGEWLQLSNNTDQDIDLKGWVLFDEDNDEHVFKNQQIDSRGNVRFDPVPLPARGSIILCREIDQTLNGGVDCDYSYGTDFQMRNEGDRIILWDSRDFNSHEIDRVHYALHWIVSGKMNVLNSVDADNANFNNWTLQDFVALAAIAPGADTSEADETTTVAAEEPVIEKKPSPYPQVARMGDILITELMIDPTDVGDNRGEWIELYNASPRTLNLEGWRLSDEEGDEHIIDDADGILAIESGELLTLCREGDYLLNGGVACDYTYGAEFQLKNEGDRVILSDTKGTTIARLYYANYWVSAGKSAAMVNPGIKPDPYTFKNWNNQEAVAIDTDGQDTGTPGRRNVAFGGPVSVTVQTLDNSRLRIPLPTSGTMLGQTSIKVGTAYESFRGATQISATIEPALQDFVDADQSVQIMAWQSDTQNWEVVGSEKDIQNGKVNLSLTQGTIITFISTDPLAAMLYDQPAPQPETPKAPKAPEPAKKPKPTPVVRGTQRVFKDVAPAFWAYDYIKALKDAGVIHGYPDGFYRPHRFTNRAEMAKIALRAFDQKPHLGMQSRFNDVEDSDWFAPFVEKARLLGVIQLKNNDYFRPQEIVTRAEALALLIRSSRLRPDSTRADTTARDVKQGDWFFGYVRFAEDKGIIDSLSRFQPEKPVNRADVATMAARVMEYAETASTDEFFTSYEEMKARSGI